MDMTLFNYLVDAQSAITIYSTGGADYTWTASDSGNSGLSPPAVAPQSSASVEASLTPTSGPVIVTVKQADGIVAEGPTTIQTEVSTATPPVITTVVFTDSPVVVTTVTTSLLCTCDQAAEVGMDSNEGSFSKRVLASNLASTIGVVHRALQDTSPTPNRTASVEETIQTDLATALVNSPDTTLSIESISQISIL